MIVFCVIYYSGTRGGILDRAIEAEDSQHHDFLRLQVRFDYNAHGMLNSQDFLQAHIFST